MEKRYGFCCVALRKNIHDFTTQLSVFESTKDHDQQHCCHHAPTVKPEAATAVVVAHDDGHEDARNMLSCI